MSAVRLPGALASGADHPTGPQPRRVQPPRWLDLRLLLGVLLVLGSVLLGAHVIGAADATVPVWAAAGDLAAGSRLTPDDLVPVHVRLDKTARAYLATGSHPEGRTLNRAVRAGELVPRSAVAGAAPLVDLALPVQAGFVPPSLARGQLVDVYAVTDQAAGAPASTGSVAPVVLKAPVQAVSGRSTGVLSSAMTTLQVVVAVAPEDAAGILGAIGGHPLVVVVHASVDAGPTG